MTEEPDSGRGCLMLSLHRLLYLALNLSEDRMMWWPSCQMKRKHGCRPLEQSGRSQEGTTGTSRAATRRQWKGQTTSWFQDHVWDQLDDWLSLHRRDFTYFASISLSILYPRYAILSTIDVVSSTSWELTFDENSCYRSGHLNFRVRRTRDKFSMMYQGIVCLHLTWKV